MVKRISPVFLKTIYQKNCWYYTASVTQENSNNCGACTTFNIIKA